MELREYVETKSYHVKDGVRFYNNDWTVYTEGAGSPFISRLPTYSHTRNFGIDRVAISIPRWYFNEKAFENIKHIGQFSRLVFINVKGKNVFFEFQRELFDESRSYLDQIQSILRQLYKENSLLQIPSKKTIEKTVDGQVVMVTRVFDDSSVDKEPFEFLWNKMVLQEIEVFFDHEADFKHYLRYPMADVKKIGSSCPTIYSNDFKGKKRKEFSKHSSVKIYSTPEARRKHHQKPSTLEMKYPMRVEFTLSKEKMRYMGMKGLDGTLDQLIDRLQPALAKMIHESAPWFKPITSYQKLVPRLRALLNVPPKKRLKMPRAFMEKTRGPAVGTRDPEIMVESTLRKRKENSRVDSQKIRTHIYIKDRARRTKYPASQTGCHEPSVQQGIEGICHDTSGP